MEDYALYLESGPKMRTTMVHVIDLLGCIATGRSTDEALVATLQAIHTYLDFVLQCGEKVDIRAQFSTHIAQHIMQGPWIGYGDPEPGFKPDFEPLEPQDLAVGIQRVRCMQQEMMDTIMHLPAETIHTVPSNGHRPLFEILLHATETQSHYLTYLVGKIEDFKPARAALTSDPDRMPSSFAAFNQILLDRFANLTAAERSMAVPHGKVIWTARRGLRRLLEHNWEHLMEIRTRLETGE